MSTSEPSVNSEAAQPALAVVVPVKNETENLKPLISEIAASLRGHVAFEIVYVDDGSDDDTPQRLQDLTGEFPELRVFRHKVCCGQSAAVSTGVRMACAPVIATLDGDGQNDPADIPALLARFRDADDVDKILIAGHRVNRRDTLVKRLSSRFANSIRRAILKDDTPDTGCGLKIFSRAAFVAMPRFDHMHRYLPALMIRSGGSVVSHPVNHRPRERGTSKYGVWNRLWVGITDLFGVSWLIRRGSVPVVEHLEGHQE
jgi:dolichol-phosphate mannosyltransferase